MRLLLGIIFGALLTVGAAYVSDSIAAPGAPRMVNWEVVNTNLQSAGTQIRSGWDRLTASLDRHEPDHRGEGST